MFTLQAVNSFSQLVAAGTVAAFGSSWLLTRIVRQVALRRDILDHPVERSSHVAATPRGAGLAIVIVFSVGACVLAVTNTIGTGLTIGLVGGGLLVAAVGWLDDVWSLPATTRLIAHFLSAAWLVWWLGGLPALDVGTSIIQFSTAGSVLAIIAIVWSTNLYNFMDGIDGLAGSEAISVSAIGGVLLWLLGNRGLASLSLLAAAAVLGFLVLNWPPAKVFLGDVGSGFLGFLFGGLALASEISGTLPLVAWLIVGSAFIVDSTLTLIRRGSRGSWLQPHKTHAYQRAVQSGLSHASIARFVIGLNLVLGLVAYLGTARDEWLIPALIVGIVLSVTAYSAVEWLLPFNQAFAAERAPNPRQ